jgi:glycogen(starch) synthase
MKILAFTPQYLPFVGGIELLVDMLAYELRSRSAETVVVTEINQFERLPERDEINGTNVYRLNFFKAIRAGDASSPLAVLNQLSTILEAEKPDLIHVHSAVQCNAWYLLRLLKRSWARPPLIVTQHGELRPVDHLSYVCELLLKADVLTAVSSSALQSALQLCRRTQSSIVIYNGVPAPKNLTGNRNDLRNNSRPMLTCVGRLESEKGFDVAIAALAKLRLQGVDAELMLVGCGTERHALRKIAGDCNVAKYVHLSGALEHHRALEMISRSSLVLVPSRSREGFSLVAAEAAVLGVPCVASRVGGLPEVIQEGETGLLVAPDDADALARAVASLLSNPERLRAMGANAQSRALERFDFRRCVENYLDLYRRLTRVGPGSTIAKPVAL